MSVYAPNPSDSEYASPHTLDDDEVAQKYIVARSSKAVGVADENQSGEDDGVSEESQEAADDVEYVQCQLRCFHSILLFGLDL